jgi:hypothetical protein
MSLENFPVEQEVGNIVRSVIAESAGVEVDDVHEDHPLEQYFGLDLADVDAALMEIEEQVDGLKPLQHHPDRFDLPDTIVLSPKEQVTIGSRMTVRGLIAAVKHSIFHMFGKKAPADVVDTLKLHAQKTDQSSTASVPYRVA